MGPEPQEKSTLVEHQAVAHRPKQPPTPPSSTPPVEESKPEVPDQQPEPEKSKVEVIKKPREISTLKAEKTPVEVTKPAAVKKNVEVKPPTDVKKPAEVIRKLVDDWDEDEDDEMEGTTDGGSIPKVTGENGNLETKPSDVPENDEVNNVVSDGGSLRPSVDKSEELDEDQIVANVDDSIIKTLVDKKRPTVQCEECYECFEDQEKL